jgi:hypothetical protein
MNDLGKDYFVHPQERSSYRSLKSKNHLDNVLVLLVFVQSRFSS